MEWRVRWRPERFEVFEQTGGFGKDGRFGTLGRCVQDAVVDRRAQPEGGSGCAGRRWGVSAVLDGSAALGAAVSLVNRLLTRRRRSLSYLDVRP
ncbi:hypothetical protein D5S18_20560 [Nocardia panacis]|uniref:Uncharacterized protein n=1 Tax=Nocardia panacis TaxID=2340916 RepID=A0A3A4K1I0_9NOCA|nr:hypothetical protein D5S18_20560 [Nocardia panacis]